MGRDFLFKPLDILVIALAAAFAICLGGSVYSREKSSSRVIIRGPDKTWIFPLDAEEKVTVTGSAGETTVRIHGGRAAIVSSPCGGQTCVAAGEMHRNGQWAACLPNMVFILIEGGGESIDAASW